MVEAVEAIETVVNKAERVFSFGGPTETQRPTEIHAEEEDASFVHTFEGLEARGEGPRRLDVRSLEEGIRMVSVSNRNKGESIFKSL